MGEGEQTPVDQERRLTGRATALDPRLPVIVGGGQVRQRPDDLATAVEPVALMQQALEAAAVDAGSRTLLASLGLIVAVKGAWRYPDAGRLIADAVGASRARTAMSTDGGNTPQSLVNRLAGRIARGELDAGAIVGGETIWSRRRQRAAGIRGAVTEQDVSLAPDEVIGKDLDMSTPHEIAMGLDQPISVYPLFETALRAARGESVGGHRDRIARLWQRFNAVAVENPAAWLRTPLTAEEIRDPAPGNRWVGYPYTKAMCSNWDLDLGAAVIVCSVAAAEAAGVPRDRWVFLHSGADGSDTPAVSNRWSLAASPALGVTGRRTLELAGVGPDDLAHVDLYSCFPVAVEAAAEALGLGEERDLTVTGGLCFAGGPLNNYVTHSIAAMLGVLRDDAGSTGLVTANGGYLTKHAMGVYSTEPPRDGFRWEDVQPTIDELPTREVATSWDGDATVEALTVMHGRDGAERGIVGCLLDDGRRTWASTTDPSMMAALMAAEQIGRRAHVAPGGVLDLR